MGEQEFAPKKAFDVVLRLFEHDIDASGSYQKENIDVSKYRKLYGRLTHEIDDGSLEITFAQADGTPMEDEVIIFEDLEQGVTTEIDISILPPLPYMKVTINNNDGSAKEVMLVISGEK